MFPCRSSGRLALALLSGGSASPVPPREKSSVERKESTDQDDQEHDFGSELSSLHRLVAPWRRCDPSSRVRWRRKRKDTRNPVLRNAWCLPTSDARVAVAVVWSFFLSTRMPTHQEFATLRIPGLRGLEFADDLGGECHAGFRLPVSNPSEHSSWRTGERDPAQVRQKSMAAGLFMTEEESVRPLGCVRGVREV